MICIERIIFPIYNEEFIVGIKGNMGKDQEQLDDVKYVLYPCQKGFILYNWYRHYYIEEKKKLL